MVKPLLLARRCQICLGVHFYFLSHLFSSVFPLEPAAALGLPSHSVRFLPKTKVDHLFFLAATASWNTLRGFTFSNNSDILPMYFTTSYWVAINFPIFRARDKLWVFNMTHEINVIYLRFNNTFQIFSHSSFSTSTLAKKQMQPAFQDNTSNISLSTYVTSYIIHMASQAKCKCKAPFPKYIENNALVTLKH